LTGVPAIFCDRFVNVCLNSLSTKSAHSFLSIVLLKSLSIEENHWLKFLK
jgi:hypothetical protein